MGAPEMVDRGPIRDQRPRKKQGVGLPFHPWPLFPAPAASRVRPCHHLLRAFLAGGHYFRPCPPSPVGFLRPMLETSPCKLSGWPK